MFRSMPFLLVMEILVIIFFHQWIPLPCKSFFYSLSLSIKSIILFILPALIFGLLFKSVVQLSGRASKTILFILGAICLSNFCSTLFSYSAGFFVPHLHLSIAIPTEVAPLQAALWTLSLPQWISNGIAMGCGAALGLVLGMISPKIASNLAMRFEQIIATIMRLLVLVIPLFIGGFLIKIGHDQILGVILKQYGLIFAIVACVLYTYVGLCYKFISKWQRKSWRASVKNMLPAAVAGFSSMSSAAAMPLTLLGAQKNADDKDLARSIIPATVNIHLVGDCFAIPIFACAILSSFGMPLPSLTTYLIFASYFVLAKFSVAAVPGGGILVMLPILQAHLGFNAEMLSLITALYILFDPVITCANVLGNGAFAMALSRKKIRAINT